MGGAQVLPVAAECDQTDRGAFREQALAICLLHLAEVGGAVCKSLIYWSGRRDSNPRPQPWQGWGRIISGLFPWFPEFDSYINFGAVSLV
jgi:hypothetical protein